MAVNLFRLSTNQVIFQALAKEVQPAKTANFVKNFFLNGKNHLARFTRLSSGIDKVLKTTISTLDLSTKVVKRIDPASTDLAGLSASHRGFREARAVLGLFNVFHGSIPGMVASVRLCHQLVQDMQQNRTESSLVSGLPLLYDPQDKTATTSLRYNQIAIGKKQQILQTCRSIFSAIGAGAYACNFGAIRPIVLANQYGSFLSSSQVSSINLAAEIIMCANHCAGIGGSITGLMFESAAFTQAKAAMAKEADAKQKDKVKQEHRDVVVTNSITLVEKFLELVCDIIKLSPLNSILPQEVKPTIGILVGSLGLYKVWKAS